MNIGAVIERVQKVGDLLEKLIQQSNELRDRVIRLEENADETSDRVAVLDAKLDRQTALLEAVAERSDVDPGAVYAEHDLDGPIEAVAGVEGDATNDAPDAEATGSEDESGNEQSASEDDDAATEDEPPTASAGTDGDAAEGED